MKNLFKIIFLIMGLIIIVNGCVKSNISIYPPDYGYYNVNKNPNKDTNSSNSNSSSDNISSLVSFTANVEGLNLTKSMTPIQLGTLANIYAYDSATFSLITNGSYQANSLGTLTGLDDYKMYLPNGVYDFYAVSTNDDVTPPTFTNFTSTPLSNGIDYLWWGLDNQLIYSSAFTANIVFTHRACQVVFNISEGEDITIDSIAAITTTAPTEGATMNLKTGVITPTSTQQNGFINLMGINGLVAQTILLPATNWKYMGVILHIFVNGESTVRYFGGQVPIPNSTLIAGNSYQFSLIINSNDIVTSSVNVSSWTIVKDNIPIYPSEL